MFSRDNSVSGFVFDAIRFKLLLQLGQEPSAEIKKLQILLYETLAQVKRLERESGAAIVQADGSRGSARKSDAETKEVSEKMRAKEKSRQLSRRPGRQLKQCFKTSPTRVS